MHNTDMTEFNFPAHQFWIINIFTFIISTALLIDGVTFDGQKQLIMSLIFYVYLVLRFLVKQRPPKQIVIDHSHGELRINSRLPNKNETISFTQINAVQVQTRATRFPMTTLSIGLNDNTRKTYFFEVSAESDSFFSFPKEVTSDNVLKLVDSIQNVIQAENPKTATPH